MPSPDPDHDVQHDGYVLDPGDGDGYWWLGATTVNKLTGERTEGRLDASVQLMPPGYAPPRHSHESDEFFFVIEGRLRVFCDGRVWEAEPGSFVFFPWGSVHGFEVIGEHPARMLIVTAGSNFAELVAAVGEPTADRGLPPEGHGDVSMERLVEASAKLGIRYVDG